MNHPYDIIIGLEIHVQLQTESKMFSWCGTEFGLPPNTQTDPVSLGLPGTLPVMNRKAFELALKTAVALHAEIAPFTKWDRKNYYYPDLPKNYQISQYDLPFSRGGWIAIPRAKGRRGRRPVRSDAGPSRRRHRQADACGRRALGSGPQPGGNSAAGNRHRARHPQPGRRPRLSRGATAHPAVPGVSDCEMQEGSLRCDANVNLHIHKDGKKIATPIVEIKNLNSFRAVEKALHPRSRAAIRQSGKTMA